MLAAVAAVPADRLLRKPGRAAERAVGGARGRVRDPLRSAPVRCRIIRQVVTESLLLALAGGVGGLVLSRVFIAALARMFFSMDDEGHPLYYDFSQSWAIAAATMMAAVVAGVLFSILPASRAIRRQSLRPVHGRSTSVRWSTGRWLLGAQAATAVAMIATAALLAAGAGCVASATG